jgi:large subunit ribosomal protein L15
MRPGFEGGQNPQTKRLPELRGFTNIFRTEYATVNIERLNRFDAESEISPETMVNAGLVKSLKYPIKILGNGDIDRPLKIIANKFTRSARQKIEAAGGEVEEI